MRLGNTNYCQVIKLGFYNKARSVNGVLFNLVLALVTCLFVVNSTFMPVFAAPLSGSEPEALQNWPTWVASQCSISSTPAVDTPNGTINAEAAQEVAQQASSGNTSVGFALYDSTGKQVANYNDKFENYGGSITKSMLLVAYLKQVGSGSLNTDAITNLTDMIENSDNGSAANPGPAYWVYSHLNNGLSDVKNVAVAAGMTGFKPDTSDPLYVLGQSQITANDFAKFFSKIDTLLPAAQKAFGLGLLSHLSAADQVGLLQANLPGTVYSKEGWKPEPDATNPFGAEGDPYIVNQAAQFTSGSTTYGVAVTVAGTNDQISGETIVKNVVSALVTPSIGPGPTTGATNSTTGSAVSNWVTTGATEDNFSGGTMSTGLPTTYNNGMTYAELLIAGTNAGLHPNLGEILGKGPGVLPTAFSIDIRYNGKEIDDIRRIDVGSGQPGDSHYTVDIEQPAAQALGFPGKADIQVRIHDSTATPPTGGTGGGSTCACTPSTNFGPGTLPSSVPAPYNSIFTAAANKFDIAPALLAGIFYGGEHGNSFPDPPPPYGHGSPWASSGTPSPGSTDWPTRPPGPGAAGPFQFEYPTWQKYGVNANGNGGSPDVEDLIDAAFGASNYLAASGAKGTTDQSALSKAILAYNNAQFYLNNVLAAYTKFGGASSGTGTTTTPGAGGTGGGGCGSQGAPDCTSGSTTVTGDAKILCEAEQYKGIYYTQAGHKSYSSFRQQCPIGALATAAQTSTAGSPGPCGTDCSGLVSFAVDQAFGQSYLWLADKTTGHIDDQDGNGAHYWQSVPISQAQAGDIVSLPDHVEIVDHVQGNQIFTFGAHMSGQQIGQISTPLSYWTAGAWHWTGPGSS